MRETFYIYFNERGSYQIRTREGDLTIVTASSEESILQKLDSLVSRYKTRARFERELRRGDLYRYSSKSEERKAKEQGEEILAREVEAVVKNALKEVREESVPRLIKPVKAIKSEKREVEVKTVIVKKPRAAKIIKPIGMLSR